MVVPVETRDGFVAGKPVRLFDDRYLPAIRTYISEPNRGRPLVVAGFQMSVSGLRL
jgi:hypothetical protein